MKTYSNSRYLTKTRFKEALDCPTKLFYTKKKGPPKKVTTRLTKIENEIEVLKDILKDL